MEELLGDDFADVRVNVGPEAPALGARAFTAGDALFFAPGAYRPDGLEGQRLLAHELSHVVQQRSGRVPNPLGRGCAAVIDPRLEREAEYAAARITSPTGRLRRVRPGMPTRRRDAHATAGSVLQLQRWGWVGQRTITSGAPSRGPFDDRNDLGPEELKELLDVVTKKGRPATEDRYVEYHSVRALNEVYEARGEAWARAKQLASEVTRVQPSWPCIVYLIDRRATDSVTPADARALCEDAMDGPLDHHFGRIWARFRHRPDGGWLGFYYEYERQGRGGALLLVEHTQDPESELTVRRVGRKGQELSLSPAKHFHVATYRREIEGPGVTFFPINHHGKSLKHGPYRVLESQVLEGKRKYDVVLLPEHHLYYLED
jgi:hypothetical protein